jgi:nitroreductase
MTAPTTGGPAPEVLREVVTLACRAPSMHNSQPWAWRITGHALELHADHERGLAAADPTGRHVLVGCGAALHHAQVAAAALGWTPTVHRFPHAGEPDLLAVVELRPTGPAEDADDDAPDPRVLLRALLARRTDRRQFTSWPVPPERLAHLAAVAAAYDVTAVPVTDDGARHRVEQLVAEAARLQRDDTAVREEHERWLDRSAHEGVPRGAVPRLVPRSSSHRSRFGPGHLPQPGRELETWDALLVLGTDQDDAAAWLATGEALGALWLEAVRAGLSLLPLSQVVEVPVTREALQGELPDTGAGTGTVPQLVVRVGWPSTALAPLAPTPRRPVEDVLRP